MTLAAQLRNFKFLVLALSYALGLEDGMIIVQPFAENGAGLSLETSGTPPRSIAYSPDGSLLATGDDTGQIFLWNLADGSLIRKWPAHTRRVDALAFSPQGDGLASGSIDNTVVVWRLDEPVAAFARQHRGHVVRDLAFSPDGLELAVALGNSIEENFYDPSHSLEKSCTKLVPALRTSVRLSHLSKRRAGMPSGIR